MRLMVLLLALPRGEAEGYCDRKAASRHESRGIGAVDWGGSVGEEDIGDSRARNRPSFSDASATSIRHQATPGRRAAWPPWGCAPERRRQHRGVGCFRWGEGVPAKKKSRGPEKGKDN